MIVVSDTSDIMPKEVVESIPKSLISKFWLRSVCTHHIPIYSITTNNNHVTDIEESESSFECDFNDA